MKVTTAAGRWRHCYDDDSAPSGELVWNGRPVRASAYVSPGRCLTKHIVFCVWNPAGGRWRTVNDVQNLLTCSGSPSISFRLGTCVAPAVLSISICSLLNTVHDNFGGINPFRGSSINGVAVEGEGGGLQTNVTMIVTCSEGQRRVT